MRISDWSSDVCSSDLGRAAPRRHDQAARPDARHAHPASDLPAGASTSDALLQAGDDGAASRAGSRDAYAGTPKRARAHTAKRNTGMRQSDTNARGAEEGP